ncbi:serine/arginine repetitive matrix protein 3-like [Equus quagga]|uniref:serine/arginine repetitive matrix protein 3-like n=1 Tax=Equus quagga TaxID=89248 RepID=UPI001EE38620|nr:serine/arginine repetitive matrix protein 3-like [Equus quagga]
MSEAATCPWASFRRDPIPHLLLRAAVLYRSATRRRPLPAEAGLRALLGRAALPLAQGGAGRGLRRGPRRRATAERAPRLRPLAPRGPSPASPARPRAPGRRQVCPDRSAPPPSRPSGARLRARVARASGQGGRGGRAAYRHLRGHLAGGPRRSLPAARRAAPRAWAALLPRCPLTAARHRLPSAASGWRWSRRGCRGKGKNEKRKTTARRPAEQRPPRLSPIARSRPGVGSCNYAG